MNNRVPTGLFRWTSRPENLALYNKKTKAKITSEYAELDTYIEGEHVRQAYLLNGELHREDGPAVLGSEGGKFWFKHGELHREDGPAIELRDGTKGWFVRGRPVNASTQQEFDTWLIRKGQYL